MSAIITQLGNGAASNEPAGGLAEVMVSQRPLLASERAMLTHYLAKKWGLTDTVDSDGDGRTDADETLAGTLAFDATSVPLPDLSDAVNAQIGEVTGLDAVEGNLALWLDASNINGLNNSGLANGDAIAEWTDLSANEFHNTYKATPADGQRWKQTSLMAEVRCHLIIRSSINLRPLT